MSNRREYRIFKSELRAAKDGNAIEGYASVFNVEADIGYFSEKIAPGAFARAIREKQDVRALFNHDPNFILGRTTSGTLTLTEDNTGLKYHVDMPDTQAGRDVRTSIDRGDISQCSFGFIVRDEEVTYDNDGNQLRTVKDVDLFDVSPVTYPAYPTTSVEARSNAEVNKKFKRDDDTDAPDADTDDGDFNESEGICCLDESSMCAEQATRCRAAAGSVDDDVVAQHLRDSAKMHDEHSDRCAERSAAHFDRAADCRATVGERAATKTKRVSGEDLPASSFLYVGDPNKTATWELPWKFSTEDKTKSHLRNALARFDQATGIPSDQKAEVYAKLVAKCKEYGIHVSGESESNSLTVEQAKRLTYLAELTK